ncbi:MAG TPA: PrsW family glutamic-type intramembrane protease, partial [Anaerolineales bacterium]|nr:PrsW family glutamic-type intramembrane protease [Anaerolineales bacterium]
DSLQAVASSLFSIVAQLQIRYDFSMTSMIALTIATLIPLVFLYAVYVLDMYHTGAFRSILYCLAWGGVAYFLAVLVNDTLVNNNLVREDVLVRFTAPFVEETLKGLFLLYLIRRPSFTYFVDGAIYGFACGIGFAIFENYEYVLGNPSSAVALAISRVLSTNLIHATGSALIGISLGIWRLEKSRFRFLLPLGGWLLALAMHSTFNNIVSDNNVLIFAFGLSFMGIGAIVVAIFRGLKEEKSWIEEELGMADRVTSNEAAIVQRLNKVGDILSPLAERFGSQKASQIERFLLMQARLGILRKTAEKLQEQDLRRATQQQIEQLRQEMDEARRSVGAYCMLYLRNIFPENQSPIYDLLQQRLASTDKNLAGTGLWKTLDQRVKPSNQ